ncbi:MAG TPA: threonine/serine dehydratase, partial [Syntrophomonadaceae bacterium]|nr:threonine/serine dehydratase [Syntrophomonadaceae bacterium]
LEKSLKLSKKDTNVYFKLENQQRTGSYKIRGVLSKITGLTKEELNKGIVAISSGNHGAATSYVAGLLGIKNASVYMPQTTPRAKVDKIQYYGAQAVKIGKNYDEAREKGLEKIKDRGSVYIDSCSDGLVIAGQGTIALEILEEAPHIDTILVPIGGGGLITGISIGAKAINPQIKVIGLQTAACPAMIASLRDNKFYEMYPTEESICDALVGGVGEIPFKMARDTIDDIIAVDEVDIREAVKYLLLEESIIAEPAGAIGLAAIRKNPHLFRGKNVAVIVTGGNIDKELLLDIINK